MDITFNLLYSPIDIKKKNSLIYNNTENNQMVQNNDLDIYDEININNYKEHEKYIYYINKRDHNKLYRINMTNKSKKVIINYSIQKFVLCDNCIVYTMYYDRNIILNKCNLDGKGNILLSNTLSSAYSFDVFDNKVFYCETINSKNYLKQIDFNNTFSTLLYEPLGKIFSLNYYLDCLYYKQLSEGFAKRQVFKKLTIQNNKEESCQSCYEQLFLHNQYIIYKDIYSKNLVIKDITTNSTVCKVEKCNKILGIWNNVVFFTFEGFTDVQINHKSNMLYSFNIGSTPSINKILDCDIHQIQSIDKYLYYKNKPDSNHIYRYEFENNEIVPVRNKALFKTKFTFMKKRFK